MNPNFCPVWSDPTGIHTYLGSTVRLVWVLSYVESDLVFRIFAKFWVVSCPGGTKFHWIIPPETQIELGWIVSFVRSWLVSQPQSMHFLTGIFWLWLDILIKLKMPCLALCAAVQRNLPYGLWRRTLNVAESAAVIVYARGSDPVFYTYSASFQRINVAALAPDMIAVLWFRVCHDKLHVWSHFFTGDCFHGTHSTFPTLPWGEDIRYLNVAENAAAIVT